MELDPQTIRRRRLAAHHLRQPLPREKLAEAASACGFQNSPPGSWETAAFNRVEGCTREDLENALCRDKTLLQAWSWRGVPAVFPADEAPVFLSPLAAQPGEEPWIYTRGITLGLDHLGMDFYQLLPLMMEAVRSLDGRTIRSKESLDQFLADQMEPLLPLEKLPLWRTPSLYGSPDRQTVGGAVVSFLLRPCSFQSLVVFGQREGITPTFTSFRSWTGREPSPPSPAGEKALVTKFLHCYGPARPADFQAWLGSSPRQARRLWDTAAGEMEPVLAGGKKAWLLRVDLAEAAAMKDAPPAGLRLLGPHDPYLDLRDREVILPDVKRQRVVWRTVGNPGVVLLDGRIAGIWKTKTVKSRLELSFTLWEALSPGQKRCLEELAERWASFRGLTLAALKTEE